MIHNPIFAIDFYKVGHIDQYPVGTTHVWGNWTPRRSRLPGCEEVVFLGLRYLIEEYLIKRFNEEFFEQPRGEVLSEYATLMTNTLGLEHARTDHIEALWLLGYLPIKIYALPEGTKSPIGVPQMVITNTHPDFFWLPNYLETLISSILWKPSTSATQALRYRRICEEAADMAGETDRGYIDYQCHDFSGRGMSGSEDVMLSGLGHLTCFSGTDSVQAILAANHYYDAPLNVGGSIPATEHSVMSAGEKDGELATFKRLITEVYPSGPVSIVSDTWDLWKVLTEYVPALREDILARDGVVVIRPDSGDPVQIMCGNPLQSYTEPTHYGTLRLLALAVGTQPSPTSTKYLGVINKMAAIYGDSITENRARSILNLTMHNGLHPKNVVFGVGSYTYEYVTRDTHGFAMKATACRVNGKMREIFKDPVTDDGGKKSAKGIVVADWNVRGDKLKAYDECVASDLDNCAFELVYCDGEHLVRPDFETIRKRVRS